MIRGQRMEMGDRGVERGRGEKDKWGKRKKIEREREEGSGG